MVPKGRRLSAGAFGGAGEGAPVQHQFMLELQQRRLAGQQVFEEHIAALAQHVGGEHAALPGVDAVGRQVLKRLLQCGGGRLGRSGHGATFVLALLHGSMHDSRVNFAVDSTAF